MRRLIERTRCRGHQDAGFTLVELLITVVIVGVISAGLAGVVMSYLKTTTATQARLTESHDVQFVAAYWQQDVASIGVRSNDYNETEHTFNFERSVAQSGELAQCEYDKGVPGGTPIVTLAWSEPQSLESTAASKTVTITYLTLPDGDVFKLFRVRCTDSAVDTTVEIAHNLRVVPDVVCSGGVTDCTDDSDAPAVVTMKLEILDPHGHGNSTYEATLVGERRQT